MTSKKFEVRRLKCFSYEGRISELHSRLAASLRIATSQEGGQEKRVEKECPHDANVTEAELGPWGLELVQYSTFPIILGLILRVAH